MINVAIVEDEKSASDLLLDYFEKFGKEKKQEFNVRWFDNPVTFLTEYTTDYDLVFMDIELPDMNGMEVTRRLREIDKTVTLVFVTNMAQYAIKGYEVDAADFIVKPVQYFDFAFKLDRILPRVRTKYGCRVTIKTADGVRLVSSTDIKYIEIIKHNLIFYTTQGDFQMYGTLKEFEPMLLQSGFVRCNHCYLVNLRYVTAVNGFTVTVDNARLLISHPKKKEFMKALNNYLGRGYAE